MQFGSEIFLKNHCNKTRRGPMCYGGNVLWVSGLLRIPLTVQRDCSNVMTEADGPTRALQFYLYPSVPSVRSQQHTCSNAPNTKMRDHVIYRRSALPGNTNSHPFLLSIITGTLPTCHLYLPLACYITVNADCTSNYI